MVPTRWIFWNVTFGVIIYPLAAIVLIVVVYTLFKRYRLWRQGKDDSRFDHMRTRIKTLFVDGLLQRRLVKNPYAGAMHVPIFVFMLFVIVFTIPAVIGIQRNLHAGTLHESFYLYYLLILDLIGALAIIGVIMAAYRRYVVKPPGLDNKPDDLITLILIFLGLISGFVLTGFRVYIVEAVSHHPSWALWSPISFVFARFIDILNLDAGLVRILHTISWWVHILLVLGTVLWIFITWSKLTHLLISPINILLRSLRPKGALSPIMNFEQEETLGAAKIHDFTWKQLLDLDACTRCGRCQNQCPAYASGKPLNPKKVIQDLLSKFSDKGNKRSGNDLEIAKQSVDVISDNGITEDEVWACTTCRACQEVCPVYIEHIDKLIDIRRNLVMEQSRFPDTAMRALRSIEDRGHPWRGTRSMRTDWTEGLDVKIVSQTSEIDILYWVSCTSALEERNMKVAAAFTKVLKAAGINFGILGNEEVCCGEPARRLGNEYLFQTQALHTLELLKSYNVNTIVTTCPHCYNTFKNEYPQFGGKLQVFHHSQYIADLVKSGKLKMQNGIEKLVTYHDPCYLGRYNSIYKSPRRLLNSIPGVQVMEMDRNHQYSFCCGGGGGHMWMEEHTGRRISDIRIEDAIQTKADILATACPYCIQLLGDRIRVRDLESIEIMDIAELAELSCRK